MKISEQRKQNLEEIYQTFLHDEKVLRMKEIPMHRGSNCYEHCFKVARLAIKRALRHKHPALEVILLAAILHDYYLYDWRKDRSLLKHHGQNHPYLAAENAEKDFGISPVIKEAIQSHMWPINFKEFPKTKEARIVSLADKAVCIREAMTSKRHKAKNRERYLQTIGKLFDE